MLVNYNTGEIAYHSIIIDKNGRKKVKFNNLKNMTIKTTIDGIKAKHGKDSIIRLGDKPATNLDGFSTGSISLDMAIGGCIPRGRVIEIYGNESAGKTTLAQHIIAEAQKKGGNCAFIDAEHSLDPEYSKKIGVNVDDLILSQPDNGEQALDILEDLVRSGSFAVIVIDSVSALVPKAEIEGEMGDSHMGLQARLMSQAMRKLTGVIATSNTTVIFLNQIRMKIGIVFGNPETTSGGNALKFYSSIRIEMRKSAKIKKGEDIIGNRVKIKIVKNKVAPPFKTTEFDIMYNEGISTSGDVLDTGLKLEIIDKKGNSYSFGEVKLGVGREKAKTFLKENENILNEIKDKILL